ncbi:MAG: PucR family transcriptional regulator [Vulcanimicrobiaceae bacterium]
MTADELVAYAEGLSRVAASGGGPKALASHLASQTGVGVLLEDAQWRHIATAGTGHALPSSVRPLLGELVGRGVHPLVDGRAGRVIPIYAGDVHLGYLSIFGDGDLDALAHAMRLTAGVIAVELARELGGQRGKRRTFWERLLSASYPDAQAARDDAAARGIAVASHYVAIVLEIEAGEHDDGAAATALLRTAVTDAFRGAEADLGMLERGPTLVLFAPASREVDAANARTAATLLPRTLAKKLPHARLSGGVGTHAPLLEIARSLDEANAALAIGRRVYGGGRVAPYDDLGAYPLLLRGADAAALRTFAQNTLEPLRAYDEKHQTELERTLKLYFTVGQNVKTAAAELNVHRHTVFYRLRQINEICGCKLDTPHDQLTFRMAIAIDALTS